MKQTTQTTTSGREKSGIDRPVQFCRDHYEAMFQKYGKSIDGKKCQAYVIENDVHPGTASVQWYAWRKKRFPKDKMVQVSHENNTSLIYEAARTWRDRCLIEDGSLFEDKKLWTIELLDKTCQLLKEVTRNNFHQSLKDHFLGSDECCQLMAEARWIILLFSSTYDMSERLKRDRIKETWSWSGKELNAEHDMLNDAVLGGIGSVGGRYHERDEIEYLLEVIREYKKEIKGEERRLFFNKPWNFAKWLDNAHAKNPQCRHVILHLLFPGHFQNIISKITKVIILSVFNKKSKSEVNKENLTEIDRSLLALKQRLERKYDRRIDFHDEDIKKIWESGKVPDENNEQEKTPVSDDSLNLIFYGPPGTGKTHRVLDKYRSDYDGGDTRRYEFVTFHQSYSYEDFVEGIRPVIPEKTDEKENSNEGDKKEGIAYDVQPGVLLRICERAKQSPDERFALIIDEINRGNITKIFGELITLVEADKRLQYDISSGEWVKGDSSIEVTLPYSGELFGVPSNVDFIGTMNTADRSIALLDSALRRRFEFEEIMPDSKTLESASEKLKSNGNEIDLVSMLETMNARITRLLHRDQTIGHSYFMKIETFEGLKKVFVRKIIPLLQEAFYNDWRQIRLVFADQAVDKELQIVRIDNPKTDLFPEADDESFNASDDTFYIADEEDIIPDSIRKIYAPTKYKKSENSEDEDSDDSESDE